MTAKIYIEVDETETDGVKLAYSIDCEDATDAELQIAWATFHVAQFVGNIERDLGEYQLPLGQVVEHYLKQGNNTQPRRN